MAVGVVLSGGDGDGTLGIKAIKERGGLTLGPGRRRIRPRSIPTCRRAPSPAGFVDFAVPGGEDGRQARRVRPQPRIWSTAGGVGAARAEGGDAPRRRQEIYAILRNQVGHDFCGYKTKTFLRRVQRRMQVMQLDSDRGLCRAGCGRTPQEVRALFRDLLINVTNFFRDADAFESAGAAWWCRSCSRARGADDTVRVWVPGCATGEEVFSIAILLREHMDTAHRAAARADLRHRHRRARARRGPRRPLSGGAAGQRLAGAAGAVLHRGRRQLSCSARRCASSASSRRTA